MRKCVPSPGTVCLRYSWYWDEISGSLTDERPRFCGEAFDINYVTIAISRQILASRFECVCLSGCHIKCVRSDVLTWWLSSDKRLYGRNLCRSEQIASYSALTVWVRFAHTSILYVLSAKIPLAHRPDLFLTLSLSLSPFLPLKEHEVWDGHSADGLLASTELSHERFSVVKVNISE